MEIRLGTLNVNTRSRNCSAFAELINENSLDIFCLNECTPDMAARLHTQLGSRFDYVYAPADFAGNALFSRFPIHDSKTLLTTDYGITSDCEARSGAFATLLVNTGISDEPPVKSSMLLHILATHLSHVHEVDRVRQMNEMLSEVGSQVIVIGDLNALSKADYSIERWKEISQERERNRWMPPESALMDDLLLHRGFRDALQDSLRGGSTIGAKGTSRFDTRIDWILLPSLAEWEGECCKTDQCCDSTSVNEVAIRSATEESIYITALPSKIQVKQNSYRVIDTRHTITDHNMVICTIIFGNAGL